MIVIKTECYLVDLKREKVSYDEKKSELLQHGSLNKYFKTETSNENEYFGNTVQMEMVILVKIIE